MLLLMIYGRSDRLVLRARSISFFLLVSRGTAACRADPVEYEETREDSPEHDDADFRPGHNSKKKQKHFSDKAKAATALRRRLQKQCAPPPPRLLRILCAPWGEDL